MFENGKNFRKDALCFEKDFLVTEFFYVGPVLDNDLQTPPAPSKRVDHKIYLLLYVILSMFSQAIFFV